MRRRSAFGAATLGALAVYGCVQTEGFLRLGKGSADAGPPPLLFLDGGSSAVDASLPPLPPHSVRSVEPDHGSFAGGIRAVVRGAGFSSSVRVFFDDVEVPAEDVLPIDSGRVQVTVPRGKAGSADVSTQNGDDASTRSTLRAGFTYDPFYLEPTSGPLSGGTLVTVHGDDAGWDDTTTVTIDGEPCVVTRPPDASGATQSLECATPPGTAGAKTVTVETGEQALTVADGYTYGDSNNGFRGGLSGAPLAGALRILVLNSATGRAVPGATVVLGSEATTDTTFRTDERGVVALSRPELEGAATVTIAARCLQPITFVDVPVDTVTAYLDPVFALRCAEGGFGPVGGGGGSGTGRVGASVEGELVWPGGIEFRRAPWDVPYPRSSGDAGADLGVVAYLFDLSPDPTREFTLPGARAAVTPESGGRLGYAFETTAPPGNVTLYALAGVEDGRRSPASFTAYTLGVLTGVATASGQTTSDLYIPMNVPLDHALSLSVDGPVPTRRGPDRVEVALAVRLGTLGYILLPTGERETLLPATQALSFVGVPPLVGPLAGAEYALTAVASSGAGHGLPRSVLATRVTSTPREPLSLGGFVNVPELAVPAINAAWDARELEVRAAPGGREVDLTITDVASDGGLTTWTVVAPRGVTRVRLPELGDLGVAAGPVTITVTRASLAAFVYGSLRYGQLGTGSFTAYATDSFAVHHVRD